MEKTLLFEAFSTLSPAELREFALFVRSPFFNQQQGCVALFDYLRACREKYEAPTTSAAYESLWPGTPYDDQRLRLANSALLAVLERYLIHHEQLSGSGGGAKADLAAAYRRRSLAKHFRITLREARRAIEKQPHRHAGYYADTFAIEWQQYQFDTAARRTGMLNLQETSDALDIGFAAEKLRLACLALAHEAMYKAGYRLQLVEAALALADARPDVPVLTLYAHCYRFLADAAAFGQFERFGTLLTAHAALFPPDELRTLHLLAINFGIRQINRGQMPWLRATLDLYKSAFGRNLLLENGRLSRFAFNNAAGIALRLGELDWAEDFIQGNKNLLERQWREATASLNLARIAYARRDYRTALLHLQRADYKDLLNNLIAKTLQLKIYYETGERELLESHLASMQIFIRRHTGIGYHRTNYLRLLRYTRSLLRLDDNKSNELTALRGQLETEGDLMERDWLLEQLERLS